jgi:hypothetical protein
MKIFNSISSKLSFCLGECKGHEVGLGTKLQVGGRGFDPDEVIRLFFYFYLRNPFSHSMAQGLTQPLTNMR